MVAPPGPGPEARRQGAPRIWTLREEDILAGRTTDVYFPRAVEALRHAGHGAKRAVADFTTGALPKGWPWAVFAGLEEVVALLQGRQGIDLWALPEGTVFPGHDAAGVRLPVMQVEGAYTAYAALETPMLGFVCQATGVATQAARFKRLVGDQPLLSFGVRRMHPGVAPAVDRAAYLGGCDSVSCVASAEMLGIAPQGTMPHALMLVVGDQATAWKAFDAAMPSEVARIALVDTFADEKTESLLAAEVLGDRLEGVRLDTPGSRRGDMTAIVREVRWELALRGRGDVKVYVSGGLGEADIGPLRAAGAHGFGVGTAISDAPTVNFAMDVVEVEGKPRAKRGKYAGKKMTWRCDACWAYRCTPFAAEEAACPGCGTAMVKALVQVLRDGKLVAPLPTVPDIRDRVRAESARVPPEEARAPAAGTDGHPHHRAGA